MENIKFNLGLMPGGDLALSINGAVAPRDIARYYIEKSFPAATLEMIQKKENKKNLVEEFLYQVYIKKNWRAAKLLFQQIKETQESWGIDKPTKVIEL